MPIDLNHLALVDHHCHVLVGEDLDRPGFEALLSEGGAPPPDVSRFDTRVGLAVRRHCAPILDLPRHASPDDYLARRAELGAEETARRLLQAANLAGLLVDTGLRGPGLGTLDQLTAASGRPAHEIVRLERVAEDLAMEGIDPADFGDAFARRLTEAVAGAGAVGVKSIIAYRVGFDFDPSRPDPAAVTVAAAAWLTSGPLADRRLEDPVLERHLLWCAVDLGLPIQLHVGYGDRDIRLHRTNPALLTDWLQLVDPRLPVMLLHCYPYQREAGYLAAVYPNVYLDLGLTLSYVGPTGAAALLDEALELCPFDKMLFSTDAFGLAELYLLGALAFRRGLAEVLDRHVGSGEWATADANRIAAMIGAGNARRAYRLQEDG